MKIEPLQYSDLELISPLQPADWNNILPAIEFYTSSDFCFPFKIVNDSVIEGIGTAIVHNDVAWLAHIIVHPEKRNRGIGGIVTKHLLENSPANKCSTIYLIATNLGEPVYSKLGFETETEYIFFKDLTINKNWPVSTEIVPITENYIPAIQSLDQLVSGEDRSEHLRLHFSNGFVFLKEGILNGYYFPSFGDGLVIANTSEAGQELMKFRLTMKDHAVFPVENKLALDFMSENGFKEIRRAKRMRLGKQRNWQPGNIFNRIGGNLG